MIQDILSVTKNAEDKIVSLKNDQDGACLSITVQGGGCSGFQYDIGIVVKDDVYFQACKEVTEYFSQDNVVSETIEEDDWDSDDESNFDFPSEDSNKLIINNGDGLPLVLLDSKSVKYIKGSILDYISDGFEEKFDITNPNAVSKCGCGISFTLKSDIDE